MNDATLTFILGIIAGIGIGLMGVSMTVNYYHTEAIKHHAAEYYLDSNNERQFRWLDEPKKGENK